MARLVKPGRLTDERTHVAVQQLSPIAPVSIASYTVTTACGVGVGPLLNAMRQGRTGLSENDFTLTPLATRIGRVAAVDQMSLPAELDSWSCRNNALAWLALQADDFAAQVHTAVARYGATRVGLAVGTSTSSIGATELAYRQRDAAGRLPATHADNPTLHTPHSLGLFVAQVLGIGGPAMTISTACSSSAKVFAAAERWLRLDLVDAVVVGGVDTLCESVLHGFNALQLVSATACRPFDVERAGINLGEAGGFALLTREPAQLQLLGYGESSDAHHMSSPHPDGLGAIAAVEQALARAGLRGQDVDYLNLHGTATDLNDRVEARVVERCYGSNLHASATKGWTAHTLGAAGIVEAVICLTTMASNFRPGILNSEQLDPACSKQIKLNPADGPVRVAASHSFGFGGSNCVLVFGRQAGL